MINKVIACLNNIRVGDIEALRTAVADADRIFIVGNGGSNAIATHIAVDYRKFLNKETITINDSAMLSMCTNDYADDTEYVYYIDSYKPSTSDLLILISSSGNSKNICNVALTYSPVPKITLTGFDVNNQLRKIPALLRFYVNSNSYGVIENVHQIFLHSIIEA